MNDAKRSERVVAQFAIAHRQYLDAAGALIAEPPAFAKDREVMVPLYRAMTLTRIFDAKAVALQRTGQLGTYPSCAGQEAVGVGYASAQIATIHPLAHDIPMNAIATERETLTR